MKIITTTDSLAKFCKKAKSAPFIALDTEFMRERTFYSQLCLIQMATPDDEAILDPLADGIDLSPFLALLADKKLEKVMHAARQDMEIFYKLINAVPTPIFDTQIAAMALGFGENVSYLALVKGRLAITLDKGARFTDWSRRPLSDNQLSYALGDVTHLRDMYPGMCRELTAKNRMSWVREEMESMMDARLYDFDPELAWKRLKPRMFRQDYLAALKAAAAWREREAQTKDVPRGRILKDDGIYVIAQRKPKTVKELADVRGIPNGFANRKTTVNLVDVVQKAIANSASYAPEATRAKQMPPGLGPSVDMLKTLLRLKTEYIDIAPRLIANVSDLTELAAFGKKANIRALSGWRFEVFGDDALKMLNGEISLTLKDKKVIAVASIPEGGPQDDQLPE